MEKSSSFPERITDYITGKTIPLMGPEENRQAVERFLVEEKGYSKSDIAVNEKLAVMVMGEEYVSRIDLVIYLNRKRFMAIKCAAGSLGSREREIIAAARLVHPLPVPFCAVSDGKTAIVIETVSGKTLGEGVDVIWSKKKALEIFAGLEIRPMETERLAKEAVIFRSYDMMAVNIVSDPSDS